VGGTTLNGLEYLLLQYNPAGQMAISIGIFVWHEQRGRLWYRLAKKWAEVLEKDEQLIALAIVDDIGEKIRVFDARAFLSYCEDTLSNILTITERRRLPEAANPESALNGLFCLHVSAVD
jgi:hypothetical protein